MQSTVKHFRVVLAINLQTGNRKKAPAKNKSKVHRDLQNKIDAHEDIGKSFGVFSLHDDEDVLQGTVKLRRSSRKKRVVGG